MAQLFTLPKTTPLTDSGNLIPGAKIYFFQAGTSTPQDTYTDKTLATTHAHPILADSDGRFPAIYLDESK